MRNISWQLFAGTCRRSAKSGAEVNTIYWTEWKGGLTTKAFLLIQSHGLTILVSRRSCRSRSTGDALIVASLASPSLPNSAYTTRPSSPRRHSVRDIRTGCHSAAAAILPLEDAQPRCNWHPSTQRALVVALDRVHLIAEDCPSPPKRDWPTEMLPPGPRGRNRRNPLLELAWKAVAQSHSVLSSALCWRMCLVAVEGASSFASRNLD